MIIVYKSGIIIRIDIYTMLKEKLQKLIKSNLLLQSQQKQRLLLVLESASEKDLEALELILESSNQKLKDVLNKNLNAENIDDFVLKIKKVKQKVNVLEENSAEQIEAGLEQELLSLIDQE